MKKIKCYFEFEIDDESVDPKSFVEDLLIDPATHHAGYSYVCALDVASGEQTPRLKKLKQNKDILEQISNSLTVE